MKMKEINIKTVDVYIETDEDVPSYEVIIDGDLDLGEISFFRDTCSWCGEKHNDVQFNVDEKLSVCISCIIKTLDNSLGNHSCKGSKIK